MAQLTAIEQLMLELVNRARLDPLGEAARFGIGLNDNLPAGTISGAPMQALASNTLLNDAASAHTVWELDTDTFSHTGAGNSSADQRMAAAGYVFSGLWAWGENLAFNWTSGTLDVPAALLSEHEGLFKSAGHRENILNPTFREVGIAAETGLYGSNNALFATQNFAKSGSNVFVTGVAYTDKDGDAFYDTGEAKSGVGVAVTSGSSNGSATTETAGGYSVGVAAGSATVTFSGGGLAYALTVIVDATEGNAKVDLVNGTRIETSVTTTLGANATSTKLLGAVKADLTGNGLANTLTGNKVANALNGGDGADTLSGAAGNDNLSGGNGNDKINGDDGADWLTGQAGNDSLYGGVAADTLNGGFGADVLSGGLGKDVFVFNTAPGAGNVDRIIDYSVADDTIRIDDAAFAAIGPLGALGNAAFRIGTSATTADHRVIYNSATGDLFYDADGNGAGLAVKFATLSANLAMGAGEFVIV